MSKCTLVANNIRCVPGVCKSHGIIFNCKKTVSMTFKIKRTKMIVIPLVIVDGQNVKSVNHYKCLGIVLDTELSDDRDSETTAISILCSKRASFCRCSNAVNIVFRSFCTSMHASQLWCNFRKLCMQRLPVAYNFGCRTLYNLPWRASVSSHHGHNKWPVSSFGKELASQLWGRSSILPRRLLPWARNLALSSWANAATACGGPKIATAHCAITHYITLLYRVCMPTPHYVPSAVIHVSWLNLSAINKACNSERNLHAQEEEWTHFGGGHGEVSSSLFSNGGT